MIVIRRTRKALQRSVEEESLRSQRLDSRRQMEREDRKRHYEEETSEGRECRLQCIRSRRQNRVLEKRSKTRGIACHCDSSDFAELHVQIHNIGEANTICSYCDSKRWSCELESFCCRKGNVDLPPLSTYPHSIKDLFENNDFLKNIVAYNNLMALASMGCNEPDDGITNNKAVFKVQGKVYHRIGSLLPLPGDSPKFGQLYFYDSACELENRLKVMQNLKKSIVDRLQKALHSCNPYIKSFKAAIELNVIREYDLLLTASKKFKPSTEHCRQYNLPNCSEVAAIIPGQQSKNNLDVIVHGRGGELKRISPVHRSYDPLFYVLLFPNGEDGFEIGLKQKNGRTLSATDFYAYRLQVRVSNSNMLMKSRRLMQQYAVDCWAKIEGNRLIWARQHQSNIRADKYQGLMDAIANGDEQNAGRKVILPPTIYGSPRFYNEQFQNSMCVVRHFGKPDYFITFTTNPNWPEIKELLNPGEDTRDRPDICARVFKAKFDALMEDLLKNDILGKVVAHSATIEWQKRGLTHAHILLIMEDKYKPRSAADVNKVVSAEIPDRMENPQLHQIIVESMLHGPCGKFNENASCMEGSGSQRHCSKHFPKKFKQETLFTKDGFPEYRRRAPEDGGRVFEKKVKNQLITLDNSWVVPYNPFLSMKFQAHINCEIVNSVAAVKYLYKYILKGSDRIILNMRMESGTDCQTNDEIELYLNARYISASEAFWRIYDFPIHSRKPAIEKLPCHLPGDQTVIFRENQLDNVISTGLPITKLEAFFNLNACDTFAKTLLYHEIPNFFVWDKKNRKWSPRKRRNAAGEGYFKADTLGRIPVVSLSRHQSELYHLRMLLHHIRGPQGFNDLKTVSGKLCESFEAACRQLGLLDDDGEADRAMQEAANIRFGCQLRDFFCAILLYASPPEPVSFWKKWELAMAWDLMKRDGVDGVNANIRNEILQFIKDRLDREDLCLQKDFGLPMPTEVTTASMQPKTIQEELQYDILKLERDVFYKECTLNDQQKVVYEAVIQSVMNNSGKIFCLNASGGTGKTYLMNLILAKVRSEKKIALATALSGIASTLLDSGRTLHSRMKVPLTLTDESTCGFSRRDATGVLLQEASLLIIDEISMGHRNIFECIDRSLQDVRRNNYPFGGMTVLLGGDWRQILPVIRHGSRAQIVAATLKNSFLWPSVTTMHLSQNMRIINCGETSDSSNFSQFLDHLGSGKLNVEEEGEFKVRLPPKFFLRNNTLTGLCDFVFEDLTQNYMNYDWLANRAIISPTNNAVDNVNEMMMERFPGKEKIYKSCDTVAENAHRFNTF